MKKWLIFLLLCLFTESAYGQGVSSRANEKLEKLDFDGSGNLKTSSISSGGLTDAQLRASPVPVSGSFTSTGLTDTELRATPVPVSGTITAVTAITNALPAGTNVIGHVINDTGSTTAVTGNVTVVQPTGTNLHVVVDTAPTTAVTGTFFQATQPVSEADGANVTLGAKADAKSTATDTTAISAMSVLKQISASVQAPPSQAVTNAGAFATQAAATLTAETTKVIGTVRIQGNVGGVMDTTPGSTAPANALNLGAKGVNAEQTAVTNGQLANLITDLVGKLIVMPYANPENFVKGTTAAITDTTSTSVIASAGGSLRNYVTSILVTNSHATVGTFVKILDGSTIIWEGFAAAVGGGFASSFPVPLPGTAATAINCQPVTTGANVICSAAGYIGK